MPAIDVSKLAMDDAAATSSRPAISIEAQRVSEYYFSVNERVLGRGL